MADAVRWVTACLGDDSFERAYRENREAATEHGLACSPLAPVLMQFLDTEAPAPLGVGAGHRGQFRGTAEELLKAVLAFASAAGIGLVKSFPERPNTFSNQLRRDAALLRAGASMSASYGSRASGSSTSSRLPLRTTRSRAHRTRGRPRRLLRQDRMHRRGTSVVRRSTSLRSRYASDPLESGVGS